LVDLRLTIAPLLLFVAIIEVDLERPECNGPVMVFKTSGIAATNYINHNSNGVEKVYDGFAIVMKVDGRWSEDDAKTDFFKATVTSNDTVVLEYINFEYDIFHSPETFESFLGHETATAMDQERNNFKDDPSRMLTKTVLKFPTPHDSAKRQLELTAKPICEDNDDVTLPWEYVDIHHDHPKLGKIVNYYVCWLVCRDDVKASKRGKQDDQPQLSKAQKKMMERRAAAAASMRPDGTGSS